MKVADIYAILRSIERSTDTMIVVKTYESLKSRKRVSKHLNVVDFNTTLECAKHTHYYSEGSRHLHGFLIYKARIPAF